MESLTNLIANIPSWVARLDELNGQIDQRQAQLADVTEAQRPEPARSLRNKGSTESLRPCDEPAAHPDASEDLVMQSPEPMAPPPAAQKPGTPPSVDRVPPIDHAPPASPGGDSKTPSALKRQTNQVMAVAQARARATVRKRTRTDSVVSAEGAGPSYRTRSMIIVYYDSYVQSFFEELVKFVSASRNLMRKAKMAAKVAQIKRMAELELPEDDAPDGDKPADPDAPLPVATTEEMSDLPPLKYVSTRQLRPVSRTPSGALASGRPMYSRAAARAAGGGGDQPPDVYDSLDKCLEEVQSMSERAAHQFLRDGDCVEEIDKVQRRLHEAKALADKEMARVKKEEPDSLKPSDEPPKVRRFRPPEMRRDAPADGAKPEQKAPLTLEVDEGIDDMDHDVPKPVYRSTRTQG